MALQGITVHPHEIEQALLKDLRNDHIERFAAPEKIKMWTPFKEEDNWIIIDETYPEQINTRLDLLNTKYDWVIAREPGQDVTTAEKELLNHVVDYIINTYPDYFKKNGSDVSCALTGVCVDTELCDPMAGVAALATEDMVMMIPDGHNDANEVVRKLKSGALLFPNGWSLTSKFNEQQPDITSEPQAYLDWQEEKQDSENSARLGKTVTQIHNPHVPYYMKQYEGPVENILRNMQPERMFWRRNWTAAYRSKLFRHADEIGDPVDKLTTPQQWNEKGYLRNEHQTFIKLPQSEAVVFGVRTYIWKLSDVANNAMAKASLQEAYKNLPEEMRQYKSLPHEGFEDWLFNNQP